MIRVVAVKELRELLRDGRFRLAAAVVLVLLLAALVFGWRHAQAVKAERTAAQSIARAAWTGQGDKNPHIAAHYGMYVFKPAGVLAFVDPGADPYLGVTLKLEAHKQQLPQDAPAQDGTAIDRFGQLSAAAVLQLLVPLLIIALGFGSWSGERERGTLRQLAATGVLPRRLLAGKALGLALTLALLLVPVGLVACAIVVATGESATVARLAGLVGAYAVYFGVLIAVTLAASAWAQSSRAALVALLGFWCVTTLVVPRLASDAAGRLLPLPTAAALAQAVHTTLATGLPNGLPREEHIDKLSKALLAKHGFAGAETMMDDALLQGLELQAEAEYENAVFDHHVGAVMTSMAHQEQVGQWAAVASPVLAIRLLSMALAGTDFDHHRAFGHQAETYRRGLVSAMNDDFARNAGAAGWQYKANRKLWHQAVPFAYRPAAVDQVLHDQRVALGMLALWAIGATLAAVLASRRMQVL